MAGDYVLNGRKIFVTNAPVADLFTIYATLDPQLRAASICALIVEKGTEGLSVGKKKDKMGLRTALMAEVQLLDGLGASLYPGDLSPNDAAPTRALHRTRTKAQAIRPTDRQVPIRGQPHR